MHDALRACMGCASAAEPTSSDVAYLNGFFTAMTITAMQREVCLAMLGGLCPKHKDMAARVLCVMGNANGMSAEVLIAKVNAHYDPSKAGN